MTNNPNNLEIKAKIKSAGIYQWEIAEAVGISEPQFVRWLRRPLPPEKYTAIMRAIDEVTAERAATDGTEKEMDSTPL